MKDIILQHFENYPKSEIQDFFKLIYQSEFGPGHLISDKEANYKNLLQEYAQLNESPKKNLTENLGSDLCRLHLQVLNQTSLSIKTLQRFFEMSATENIGNIENYYEKINQLAAVADEYPFSFSPNDVISYKEKIIDTATKPLSHSETYHKNYSPNYRIVKRMFVDLLEIFTSIDALMREKESVVVAIDGDCGSGKSTLSAMLANVYDCSVIPIDHFFLRGEQRNPERFALPGGNIDQERFIEEVILPLKSGNDFSYRPFNCQTMELDSPVQVSQRKLAIIDGSYSHHPELADFYDLKIFISIPEELQLERILKRNGEKALDVFKERWIPMEKRYARLLDIKNKSDLEFDYMDFL